MTKENEVEKAAIHWLQDLGYTHIPGKDLSSERQGTPQVLLEARLRQALHRLNPHLDEDHIDQVTREVMRPSSPSLEENNAQFHKWLLTGVQLQKRHEDGATRGDLATLIDFEDPYQNDWLVTDQLTVRGHRHSHRPDLVLYLNGLPIAVFELKNPTEPNATLRSAWNQLQTYKEEIPQLFHTNQLLLISDGTKARLGSLTAGFERFGPWQTLDGEHPAPSDLPELEVLLRGLLQRNNLLEYLRHFILWEQSGESSADHVKKIAAYHQFHAVRRAVTETVRASREEGDQRIGVVWHTQGSGKSLSMLFYAGKLVVNRDMGNPTLVVVTDRNDLDGQLLRQFAKAKDLLGGAPVQAKDREHLRELLQVASGGIVFTTVQKWSLDEEERKRGDTYPELSQRRNIVVIADEAHRSQYGLATRVHRKTGKINRGFARNLRDGLPGASFIAFTGTPLEADQNSANDTRRIFGEYIHTYTITESVRDQSTVPLHYEARLARISLPKEAADLLDDEFEEVTEGQEEQLKGKLKSKWARLEAMVGSPERLALVARDLLEHWEKRLEILDGKAMIVAMSRRIAVDLYAEILELRPEWRGTDDSDGVIKVVITASSSEDAALSAHRRTRKELERLEKRFKDPDDPLRLVIVRDMWLTGFDAPCAHTLYADKPMRGHGLMQAIARVNRVFRDKPAGLVVDYIGLAEPLKKAVGQYGSRRDRQAAAGVLAMVPVFEKYFGVVRDLFHGFDTSPFFSDDPAQRLKVLAGGVDHILQLDNGRQRFLDQMAALEKAAAVVLHLDEVRDKRDLLSFFQAVRANLRKYTLAADGSAEDDLFAVDAAIQQLVAGAVSSSGVVDIFQAAGLEKPDLSILSEEFLNTLKKSEHPNLQLALLQKLLAGKIKSLERQNVVQARRFSEMLRRTLFAYQNRTLESAQVILQLIEMAKELRDSPGRAQNLGITDDELAFYDALVDHGGVREVMSDTVLAAIARDLVEAIRRSVTLDWTEKEAVRADLRRKVKRLLRKHGYPPDKREDAVVTVLEQAEVICRDWAEVPFGERGGAPADLGADVLPFREVPADEVRPFENCVPLYTLEAAAGAFSDEQAVPEDPSEVPWVTWDGGRRPAPGYFVARVVGESMNRRIPNGAFCLFARNPGGSRQGKVVLVRKADGSVVEDGAAYTVKRYESVKRLAGDEDSGWRHERIVLRPDSTDPSFEPLVLTGEEVSELRVVAELVEVLGG